MGRPESDDERQPQEPITKKRRRDEHMAPLTLNVGLDPEPKEAQAMGGWSELILKAWTVAKKRCFLIVSQEAKGFPMGNLSPSSQSC